MSPELDEDFHGLPWLADRLNRRFCARGKQICVPIGLDHALGNHVLVNHPWSHSEMNTFRNSGFLPMDVVTGSRSAEDVTPPKVVVLRFIEGHATPADPSKNEQRHEISGSYLNTPQCEDQKQVFWVVSTTTPASHQVEPWAPESDRYYIIPSGFTKASTLERCPRSEKPGNAYFTASPHAPPDVSRQLLCRGSPLFSDETFDLLRHNVQIDKLPELFAELFDTATDSDMSIPGTSAHAHAKETFRKEDYLTTYTAVHQASCDFGLSFREV